ncbi:MAG: hypothetical protein ACI4JI_07915 [Ruminiclostridium sp.]
MSLVGRWKIVEAIRFNENFEQEWVPVETILADEDLDPQDKSMYSSVMDFTEDGRVLNLVPLPEGVSQEEIDEAVKAGQIELYDGYMKLTENRWKTEDGKNYYDTGISGEALGEEVSSWMEIPVIDGKIEIMTFRIAKAE